MSKLVSQISKSLPECLACEIATGKKKEYICDYLVSLCKSKSR